MAIKVQHNVSLADISTFRMGGMATEVATVESEQDVADLFTTLAPERAWFVLGGGSNVVFPDTECTALVVRLGWTDMHVVSEDTETVTVFASAGTDWDAFVEYTVAHGWSGIEALSAIPGSVGATPIQNVGAYGSEVKDTILSVRAFDTVTKQYVEFSNAECRFAYRDSMFKQEGKGRYIVTSVTFVLRRAAPTAPRYPGVSEYFTQRGITTPTLTDIRAAIVAIRAGKLPDPKHIASVGSFFKNPIIPKEQADTLKEKHPTLAVFPVSETLSKVGAGSLIDTMGWKGKSFGTISIYKNNALVLVNEGGATQTELEKVVGAIIFAVQETFGITLEPEPEIITWK